MKQKREAIKIESEKRRRTRGGAERRGTPGERAGEKEREGCSRFPSFALG